MELDTCIGITGAKHPASRLLTELVLTSSNDLMPLEGRARIAAAKRTLGDGEEDNEVVQLVHT
jgi:hypothetical protein